jgi:hypothetical protein
VSAATQAQLPGATPAPKVTTAEVLTALIGHYRKPGTERDGEILITEPEAPGSSRRCDLLRVGMWSSRGTGIDVHEIKISRADWLRELDEPAKAEAWWPYCSRFWVTAPPHLIDPAELPQGWGLMEMPPATRRRFKVKVPAAWKAAKLTVPLMIELLRRADNARHAQMDTLRRDHASEVYKIRHERQVRQAQAEIPYEVQQRLKLLATIEEALGMPLDTHQGWPKIPPEKITPEEVAALLGDVTAHVTAQRRAEEVERARSLLEETATNVAQRARKIGAGEIA